MKKLLSILTITALSVTLLPMFSVNALTPPNVINPPRVGPSFTASAHNHTLFLAHGGDVVMWQGFYSRQIGHTLTTWGENSHGQVGLPASASIYELHYLDFPVGMVQVGAGAHHSIALDENGNVWSWGSNEFGQLGRNTPPNIPPPNIPPPRSAVFSVPHHHTPTQISNLENIVQISAGEFHNLALDDSGDVWAWGRNNFFQLGNVGGNNATPQRITTLSNITQIATKFNHNLAVQGTDTIFAWGNNSFGQLGENSTQGTNSAIPLEVPNPIGEVISGIDTGRDHSLVLMNIWQEQDGFPGSYSLVGGAVFGWGSNAEYQLGRDDGLAWTYTPIAMFSDISDIFTNIIAGEYRSLLIRDNRGIALYTGTGWFYDNSTTHGGIDLSVDVLPTLTSRGGAWNVLALGLNHAVTLTQSSVNLWGGNEYGQMLAPPTNNRISPTINYFIDITPSGSMLSNEARETEFTGKLNFIEFTTNNLQTQNFSIHPTARAGVIDASYVNSREFTFEIEPSAAPALTIVRRIRLSIFPETITTNTVVQSGDWLAINNFIDRDRFIISFTREEDAPPNQITPSNIELVQGNEDGTEFYIGFRNGRNPNFPLSGTPADVLFGTTPFYVHDTLNIDDDTPLGLHFWGLPTGVMIESVTFESPSSARVTLSGNSTGEFVENMTLFVAYIFSTAQNSINTNDSIGDFVLESIRQVNGRLNMAFIERVATPYATPNGGTFTGSQVVTLATTTVGATIHFTTDGTVPTTTSTEFITPITLTETTTIKAFAVKDGMPDSDVLEVTFTRQVGGNLGNGGGGGATTHTITFNTNGGNAIANQNVNHNGRAIRPADPTRAGFEFAGWYTDSAFTTPFDFNTQITSNITIFARWTENAPTPPDGLPFVDVNSNDWFYSYIEYVFTNNLMQGVSPTEFAPNAPTTRAMFVTVLWRLAGEPNVSGESQFVDVASGTWYSQAVAWAAENSIVLGISETEFAPHLEITREQMAAMVYRGLHIFAPNSFATQMHFIFEDADEISPFANNAIQTLANMGIMQGNSDGTFNPQGLATRAEVAAVLQRISN